MILKTVRANRATGFTVVEVLVSLLVLSVGLMGLASLQVVGMQNTQGGSQRAQAAYLAYDITDRMRSNNAAVTEGAYNFQGNVGEAQGGGAQSVTAPNCVGLEANCSAAEIAQADIQQWQTLLGTYLTNGAGGVVTVDNGTTIDVTVTVSWNDAYSAEDGREFVTFTTELPR